MDTKRWVWKQNLGAPERHSQLNGWLLVSAHIMILGVLESSPAMGSALSRESAWGFSLTLFPSPSLYSPPPKNKSIFLKSGEDCYGKGNCYDDNLDLEKGDKVGVYFGCRTGYVDGRVWKLTEEQLSMFLAWATGDGDLERNKLRG